MSEIETWLAELAERPRRAGTRDVTRLLALVRQYREALRAAERALLSPFPMEDQVIARLGTGQSAIEQVRAALEAMPHD